MTPLTSASPDPWERLNASDVLHSSGLFVVGSVFASLPSVDWLTGRPTRLNPNGMTVDIRELPSWSRYRFLAGANKYIQQESTFWRRSLWEKAGGEPNATYRDVGAFSNMERYNQRCDKTIESELKSIPRAGALRVFRRVSSERCEEHSEGSRIWQRLALKSLYHLAGPDWPPVVVDQENKRVVRCGTSWRRRPLRR